MLQFVLAKLNTLFYFLYIFNICYSTNFYTYFCDRLQVWKKTTEVKYIEHESHLSFYNYVSIACLLLMNMLLDESEIKLMKLPVFLALIIVIWYLHTDLSLVNCMFIAPKHQTSIKLFMNIEDKLNCLTYSM